MTEMEKLEKLLTDAGIPFRIEMQAWPDYDAVARIWKTKKCPQILSPEIGKVEIDAVSHDFSYGGKRGLIEIMGPKHVVGTSDGVLGYLDAEQAFKYFKAWRVKNNENAAT